MQKEEVITEFDSRYTKSSKLAILTYTQIGDLH